MTQEELGQEEEGAGAIWYWVAALVVLLLVAYPLVQWTSGGRTAEPVPVASSAPATPKPGDAELNESLRHYEKGEYEQAIDSARAVLAVHPNSAEAYNNIAVSTLALGRFDEAADAAQSALKLRPDFELAKNNLAWIARERARAAQPASAPPSADELLQRSLEFANARRFKDCIDTAKAAIALKPSARAYNNVGYCAGQIGLLDDAIANLVEALKLDPTLDIARNNLAMYQRQKLQGAP